MSFSINTYTDDPQLLMGSYAVGFVGPDGVLTGVNSPINGVARHGVSATVIMQDISSLTNYGIISGSVGDPAVRVDEGAASDILNAGSGRISATEIALIGDDAPLFRLLNDGEILAGTTAIDLLDVAEIDIANAGRIFASDTAFVQGDGARAPDSFRLFNTGEITGGQTGLQIAAQAGTVTILNKGLILGGVAALEASGASARLLVTNDGVIDGAVNLGSGADLYEGRNGMLTGPLSTGDGDDRVRGGTGAEMIDAGGDNDSVRGGEGDDTLLGGAGYDTLAGNGGNDSLEGGGRNDTLIGGKGDDTLTGGGGADTIVIRRVGNGDDVMTDFQNGSDVIDISALSAAGFADLTAAGALTEDRNAVTVDLSLIGGSGTLRLQGMTLADMDASDFIF